MTHVAETEAFFFMQHTFGDKFFDDDVFARICDCELWTHGVGLALLEVAQGSL